MIKNIINLETPTDGDDGATKNMLMIRVIFKPIK